MLLKTTLILELTWSLGIGEILSMISSPFSATWIILMLSFSILFVIFTWILYTLLSFILINKPIFKSQTPSKKNRIKRINRFYQINAYFLLFVIDACCLFQIALFSLKTNVIRFIYLQLFYSDYLFFFFKLCSFFIGNPKNGVAVDHYFCFSF